MTRAPPVDLENNVLDGQSQPAEPRTRNAHMEQQPKIVSPQLRRRPAIGTYMQIGHVVRNMDTALACWTQAMEVGPFVVLDSSVADRQFFHRGQRSAVDFSIAISYLGDVMIELIMPLNAAPSPYSEFLGSGREGLHHVGLWPDDLTKTWQALKESGFTEVSSIRRPDGTTDVIYCDSPNAIGAMVELAEMTPLRKRFLGGIKALAENWDGSRPVRRYADRAAFISSADGQP